MTDKDAKALIATLEKIRRELHQMNQTLENQMEMSRPPVYHPQEPNLRPSR